MTEEHAAAFDHQVSTLLVLANLGVQIGNGKRELPAGHDVQLHVAHLSS